MSLFRISIVGVLAWLLAALLLAAPALAQDHPLKGVALVIGQSEYEDLPELVNPNKDAHDIDQLLGDLGFEVTTVFDADHKKLTRSLERFIEDAEDADVALVYYSGHGIEASGENYLLPTDTDLTSPQSAGESLVPVSPLLDALAEAAPVTIVLLDACRSDPFPAGQLVALPGTTDPVAVAEEGLAAVRGPNAVASTKAPPDSLGSVIGFAAEPGAPALDGAPGENSPYAAALLKHLSAGGFSFGDIMTMVTEEVYLKTRAQQLPWTNSSLRRVLSFGAAITEDDPDQRAIAGARRTLLLNIATTPETTQKYVEQLAGQEQVPLDALYGMLNALGINTSDGDTDLQQQLQQGAQRLKELLANKDVAVKADAELERLSKLADDAEAEGAIALALTFRDKASARADTLLDGKREEAEKLRADMIDIADTYAANAATALLNFDQLHAADLFAKAFDAVKDWDDAKAVTFKLGQGDALTDHGYYTMDNSALTTALAVYDEALLLAPESKDAETWARIQNRIGQTQQTLGARMTDDALLEASVHSFENALRIQTRDTAPNDWAVGQNNLGNVVYSIGRRSQDIPTLERAVAAFDNALSVFTPDTDPVRWATTVSNRASAQLGLADAIYAATSDAEVAALQAGVEDPENLPVVLEAKAKAVAILTEAATALDAALAARQRDDNPLDWAMMQHARAAVLSDRGKLTASPDDVAAAVAAFRDVLTVHDRERTPVQWATSASNLAATLRQLVGLTKDPAPLTEAAGLLSEAITYMPRDQSPLDWAELQTKLGNVWSDAATYDGTIETTDKAVAAYRAAAEINTADFDLAAWQRLQLYTVQVLLQTAVPLQDVPHLKDARATAANTHDVLEAHGSPDAAIFGQWLPVLDQFIEMLGG